MAAKPPTRPSTPKLSDLARHVVAPKGAVSTGWPAVEAKCRDLGITFRKWQPSVGRLILAKDAAGLYAATIGGTGLSIPRQVGKTFLVGAIVFALCLLRPNLTVIWTAHRLRTAEETFGKMQAFARRAKIRPHIAKVVRGSGEEAVVFRNGSRILFGARESGFGLGFDEVDVLIFDEAQRLRDMTLDDMIPATNQSRQPTSALLLFMGTPPRPTDPGEVFARMRTDALSGEDADVGWVEFGSDPGYEPTPPPAPMTKADWEQVAKANPSFPDDTPRAAILRMRKKLGADSMRREGYGIWDDSANTVLPRWASRAVPEKRMKAGFKPPPPAALGIGADPDQVWLSLGAASVGAPTHLGAVLRVRMDRGRREFVAEVARIQSEHGCVVAIDAKGPASSLIPDLEAAGVDVLRASLDDFVQASAGIVEAVELGDAEHGNYDDLNAAVDAADWRKVGDRRVFARKNGAIDMLEAVALALWGARQPVPEPTVRPSLAWR